MEVVGHEAICNDCDPVATQLPGSQAQEVLVVVEPEEHPTRVNASVVDMVEVTCKERRPSNRHSTP